jgi:hypothetical protein
MDMTNAMYSPPLHEKIEFIIVGGEGSPRHEANLEQNIM